MNKTKIADKKKKKRSKVKAAVLTALSLTLTAIIICCIIFIDNKTVVYDKISIGYDTRGTEIKIAHLSDLHFPKIEADLEKITAALALEAVDLIAITGDFVDDGADLDTCGAVEFAEKLTQIAPVFYANGNHESRHGTSIKSFYDKLKTKNVNILDNICANISVKGKAVAIIGLADNAEYRKTYISDTELTKNSFKILLAHRPEKINNYLSIEEDFCPNLVLTGHAHGGQFRFFGQGMVAPDQGFFPKYGGGIYSFDTGNRKSYMVVSRGIGNSIFPLRFNNKPHIPILSVHI